MIFAFHLRHNSHVRNFSFLFSCREEKQVTGSQLILFYLLAFQRLCISCPGQVDAHRLKGIAGKARAIDSSPRGAAPFIRGAREAAGSFNDRVYFRFVGLCFARRTAARSAKQKSKKGRAKEN